MSSPRGSEQTSLADRLSKVLQETVTEEYKDLSLKELGKWKIKFGEKKLNQEFEKVVLTDPGYVKWFVRRYEGQGIASHQPFLHYIKKYVEAMENNPKGKKNSDPEKPSFKEKKLSRPSTPQVIDLGSESEWSETEPVTTVQAAMMSQAVQNKFKLSRIASPTWRTLSPRS